MGRSFQSSHRRSRDHSRLPGSDPYNSIGVLHKWDALESENLEKEAETKAARIRDSLKDFVCNVIPVSAPLGLVARHAPDSFIEGLLNLTTSQPTRDALVKALRRDNRWDDDPVRKKIRSAYDLPWVSFVRLVKILMENECSSVSAVREVVLQKSGIPRLEVELDARFFKRSALIKQRTSLTKAERPLDIGIMKWNAKLAELSKDVRHWEALSAMVPGGSSHHKWIVGKKAEAEKLHEKLEALALDADRHRLAGQEKIKSMGFDFDVLEALRSGKLPIEDRDKESIEKLLMTGGGSEEPVVSPTVLRIMLDRYIRQTMSPDGIIRRYFEHLILRMQQLL